MYIVLLRRECKTHLSYILGGNIALDRVVISKGDSELLHFATSDFQVKSSGLLFLFVILRSVYCVKWSFSLIEATLK